MLVVPIEMTFDHIKVLTILGGQKGLSGQKGPSSLFGPINLIWVHG